MTKINTQARLLPSIEVINVLDRRHKPRIRVLATGRCEYAFAKNSWLVFANLQSVYHFLKGHPAKLKTSTVHNSQW